MEGCGVQPSKEQDIRGRMSKSKQVLQVGLLTLAFGLATVFGYGLWRGRSHEEKAGPPADAQPDQAEMKLTDMEYTEMQQGRQLWTLTATEADYFQSEQKTTLKNVKLTLYLADNRKVLLESMQGSLYAGSKNIELWDSVKAQMPDGYEVTTERAAYEHQAQTIGSRDEIRLKGPDVEIKGRQWQYHIKSQQGSMEGGVEATLSVALPVSPSPSPHKP